jgi:hypothetical protein
MALPVVLLLILGAAGGIWYLYKTGLTDGNVMTAYQREYSRACGDGHPEKDENAIEGYVCPTN